MVITRRESIRYLGIAAASLLLSGCNFIPSIGAPSPSGSAPEVTMELGEEYSFCNNSLKMTLLGAERRPLSTFIGVSQLGEDYSSDLDTVVELDVSIRFNQNSLETSITQLGGNLNANMPVSLADIIRPGEMSFIEGYDADGYLYQSAMVLTGPASTENTLGTNAQWDYSLMASVLPQATTEKRGSILFLTSSTVSDMKVIFNTPTQSPAPLDPASVMTDPTTAQYTFYL